MLPNFVDASRSRDAVPLPLLFVLVLKHPAGSRTCRQRCGREKQSTIRAHHAIDVLNEMLSVSCSDSIQLASNSRICSDHIIHCMTEYTPEDIVVPQNATASLLVSCPSSYSRDDDAASSILVSYQPGKTTGLGMFLLICLMWRTCIRIDILADD